MPEVIKLPNLTEVKEEHPKNMFPALITFLPDIWDKSTCKSILKFSNKLAILANSSSK